jgi:hypothetical protein
MRRRFVLAALAATTLACSGPPTKERQQAEGAVASARAAGAAIYAPAELSAAESALTQYDAAVGQRDYRLALRLALDARDSADQAVKRASDEKTAARVEAQRLLTSVDTLIAAAKARLSGSTGPRPTGPAAERLRSTVKTASNAVQEARSQLGTQNYRVVVTSLTPIEATLRKELPAPSPATGRRGR